VRVDTGCPPAPTRLEAGVNPSELSEPCLTASQLAAWLNITERHVRRLVAERRVPFHKVGNRVRFVPREVVAWFNATKTAPTGTGRVASPASARTGRPAAAPGRDGA
jgi:excisionase family DNA binding protein